MSEKKRYIRVKSVCQGSSYLDDPDSKLTLAELLHDAPRGEDEGYIVFVDEMTEEEFKKLPEFTGF